MADAPSELVVSTTTGSGFTAALFVRELLGLSVAAQVPPLTPRVPVRRRPPGQSVTSGAWNQWWSTIGRAGAGRTVAPDDPDLAGLFEQVRGTAQNWGEAEAEEAARSYRPQWLPPLLGATTGSGRHDTEVLPVAGRWSMPLGDRRLLVSTDLCRDHDAMDDLWRARIGALVARM